MDLKTYVKVEARKLWVFAQNQAVPLVIMRDQQWDGWFHSFSKWGWQFFPEYFLVENTETETQENVAWIIEELQGQFFECTFVKLLDDTKGDQDGPNESNIRF